MGEISGFAFLMVTIPPPKLILDTVQTVPYHNRNSLGNSLIVGLLRAVYELLALYMLILVPSILKIVHNRVPSVKYWRSAKIL